MITRRLNRRPIRRVCLDLLHTDPDLPCPYCNPDPVTDGLVEFAARRHAEIAAEDARAWGWPA